MSNFLHKFFLTSACFIVTIGFLAGYGIAIASDEDIERESEEFSPSQRVVLFDLGNTLEVNDALLPGAKSALTQISNATDNNGTRFILALASDFTMPNSPQDIPSIKRQYYKIIKNLDIISFFEPREERITLSTEVGVLKPSQKFFEVALAKIGKETLFKDAIFITENRDHVQAVRRFGMGAIHFKAPGQSEGEVDNLLEVLPLIIKHFADSIDSRREKDDHPSGI